MKNLNMSQLFEKLNDVKSLFIYGQKIIPVLQSLVDFMQETVPLLENINHSIADSTSKIPRATDQINNVTNATELATTEILDLVDVISNNLNALENSLKDITEKEKIKSSVVEKLKNLLPDNAEAMQLFQEYKDNDVTISQIEKLSEVFPKIQNDTYNITLSLQVQDITSQQLAAVNHLIESVQTKLASLIHDIDDTNLKEVQSSESYSTPEGATFDPNASYDKSGDRQDMIDEIIQSENQKASQDEIDKLFS
jgi:chemotaxis regulatin CheY-phosphate phosphatase CheZ